MFNDPFGGKRRFGPVYPEARETPDEPVDTAELANSLRIDPSHPNVAGESAQWVEKDWNTGSKSLHSVR